MGHLGLTPQSVHHLGYKRQCQDKDSQEKLFHQAKRLEETGCFSIVLEHVPETVSSYLKKKLRIPVIGIGAGKDCDGQVRVTADLLGLTNKQPPFAKPLIAGKKICIDTLKDWISEQHPSAKSPTTKTS